MIGFILKLFLYVFLGVFLGLVIGRLLNAVLGRIEGKPATHRGKLLEKDNTDGSVNSKLPDEYLQRRRGFRDDEYHGS